MQFFAKFLGNFREVGFSVYCELGLLTTPTTRRRVSRHCIEIMLVTNNYVGLYRLSGIPSSLPPVLVGTIEALKATPKVIFCLLLGTLIIFGNLETFGNRAIV
jgi:hypothetical protein